MKLHYILAAICYYGGIIFGLLALLVARVPIEATLSYLAGALCLTALVHIIIADTKRQRAEKDDDRW